MSTRIKTIPIKDDRPKPPEGPLTYEQFLDWADDNTFAEWVGGEVFLMSPVSYSHQDISDFLAALLRWFVEEHDAGKVITAPFQMRLRSVQRGREPDIMFVETKNLLRITPTYLDGPADIVIEITSPESALRDRGEKYAEYEAEGVREYWVIDPEAQRVDFHVLGEDSRYERVREDSAGIYRSATLYGLWIDTDWLWQRPLPPLRRVIEEWQKV